MARSHPRLPTKPKKSHKKEEKNVSEVTICVFAGIQRH
jgi:hypothetical protein